MAKLSEFFADGASARGAFGSMARIISFFYLVFITAAVVKSALDKRLLIITPDYLFFCSLCLMYAVSKKRGGLHDFLPPAILLFSYDAMRGFVDNWATRVEFNFPIVADKLIGGGALPTAILQNAVDGSGFRAVAEITSILLYSFHFTIPILFGFIIWRESRQQYFRFMAALVILSYLALMTYWLFPVAPPWMALDSGMIFIEHKFASMPENYHLAFLPGLYALVNANPVAAIPSLHFAYPFLALIFAAASRRKLAAAFFAAYSLAVGFSIVYLGEHYAIDLIFGAVYAVAAMLIADFLLRRHSPAPAHAKAISVRPGGGVALQQEKTQSP